MLFRSYLQPLKDAEIDTLVLGCTHYPLLMETIRKFVPNRVRLVTQGGIVADKLKDYLIRHPEIESGLMRNNRRNFVTTDDAEAFDLHASLFFGETVNARHIEIGTH